MSQQTNGELAIKVAAWLGAKTGEVTSVQLMDTGVYLVDYTLGGKLQPTVRIETTGAVIMPAGTDFNLMMAFLGDS